MKKIKHLWMLAGVVALPNSLVLNYTEARNHQEQSTIDQTDHVWVMDEEVWQSILQDYPLFLPFYLKICILEDDYLNI